MRSIKTQKQNFTVKLSVAYGLNSVLTWEHCPRLKKKLHCNPGPSHNNKQAYKIENNLRTCDLDLSF